MAKQAKNGRQDTRKRTYGFVQTASLLSRRIAQVTEKRETNAYSWIDSFIRTNLTKKLELTIGARNLANIITIDATDVATGAHDSSTGASIPLGNGRSYFLKILYNLNLN